MNRLLSWPGAKFRQMDTIVALLDRDRYRVIVEPFFGTGAFTWRFGGRETGAVFAGEKSPHLRAWWMNLMQDPEGMVEMMAQARTRYEAAGRDRAVFDALRGAYNEAVKRGDEGTPEAAALLWVLVYQSTNNLARFNSSGLYNQTWGQGRRVPDPREVFGPEEMAAIRWLANRLVAGFPEDFRETIDLFLSWGDKDGAVVFLDPPYIVRTETYQRNCWGLRDELDLLAAVRILEDTGVPWLWTTYLRKDDVVHPLLNELQTFLIVPLERRMDARPTGQGTSSEEVIVVGSAVGQPRANTIGIQAVLF